MAMVTANCKLGQLIERWWCLEVHDNDYAVKDAVKDAVKNVTVQANQIKDSVLIKLSLTSHITSCAIVCLG